MHELLLLLVQEFEARNYSLHTATPIEALRELMEANGLRQKDLVGVFETASVASAVLNGRRELTKDHIKRLSEKFNVSPELFF
jgi:HTH-type transcriptional regulator/antitoxin HigA